MRQFSNKIWYIINTRIISGNWRRIRIDVNAIRESGTIDEEDESIREFNAFFHTQWIPNWKKNEF